ncbi:hypothetical protein BC832DRAFT_361102 [Gaertneriomyces semiglobifer]|nr:hypothetical protein BC832DRAFT_361102 [Gaertneriomyces semiglobifer]
MRFLKAQLVAVLSIILYLTCVECAPRPEPQNPLSIDCMVVWSDYTCCKDNIKISTGSVMVQAAGTGKPCPVTLQRKEYCEAGDADCRGNLGYSLGVHKSIVVGAVVLGGWVTSM